MGMEVGKMACTSCRKPRGAVRLPSTRGAVTPASVSVSKPASTSSQSSSTVTSNGQTRVMGLKYDQR